MSLTTKETALAALFDNWRPARNVETIPLENANGRILAEDTYAKYTLPVNRAAMMDSVALRSAGFTAGIPDTSAWTRGLEFDIADMGDDFDDRFDCAVPVESVIFCEDGRISIAADAVVMPGAGIKQAGSTVREGNLLLTKGRRLNPCDLAVLATGGYTHVSVCKKPVAVVIPTGNELVARGVKPNRGQNIEANTVMLGAMLDEMGAEAICMPVVRDDPAEISSVIKSALKKADIVVVNGGSSKGGEDYGTLMLRGMGSFLFHGVAAAPGRPLSVSIIDNKPVINLPGPPPAAFNAAEWFLKAIVAYCLKQPVIGRNKVRVILAEALDTPLQMAFTVRLYLTKNADGSITAHPIQMGRDSLVRIMAADAFFVSPVGCATFGKGSRIEAHLLRNLDDI
jgi:molybdopterin molybdotransferase/putative molybdopterin biosynthesis protein